MTNFHILATDNKHTYTIGIDRHSVGMAWRHRGNVSEFVGCLLLTVLVDSLLCLILKIDRSYHSHIYIAYLFIVVPNIGDMANINSQSKPICELCYSF